MTETETISEITAIQDLIEEAGDRARRLRDGSVAGDMF
jgi:hypothetical protein